jgi:hypothetical protein
MKKLIIYSLALCLLVTTTAQAGLSSKKTAYQGGTAKEQYFPGAKDPVEGILDTGDENELKFLYKHSKKKNIYAIPYKDIIDIEYGQKAGRRVGAAIATAILISPVGLFLLFSKKRRHFVTIGYRGTDGKDQVAVFELGKDVIRTNLAIIETRSGKQIEYQDEEARKSSKGN